MHLDILIENLMALMETPGQNVSLYSRYAWAVLLGNKQMIESNSSLNCAAITGGDLWHDMVGGAAKRRGRFNHRNKLCGSDRKSAVQVGGRRLT